MSIFICFRFKIENEAFRSEIVADFKLLALIYYKLKAIVFQYFLTGDKT
jgi:hypothetical protein